MQVLDRWREFLHDCWICPPKRRPLLVGHSIGYFDLHRWVPTAGPKFRSTVDGYCRLEPRFLFSRLIVTFGLTHHTLILSASRYSHYDYQSHTRRCHLSRRCAGDFVGEIGIRCSRFCLRNNGGVETCCHARNFANSCSKSHCIEFPLVRALKSSYRLLPVHFILRVSSLLEIVFMSRFLYMWGYDRQRNGLVKGNGGGFIVDYADTVPCMFYCRIELIGCW